MGQIVYCQYVNEIDFEGGKVKQYDNFLVASIIVANGQGSILFVWDLEENKVVSCFEEPYCIDFTVKNYNIYSLKYISYWGIMPRFQLNKIEIATKKTDVVLEEFPFDISVYNGDPSVVSIEFKNNNLLNVCFGENKYTVDIL